MIEKKSDTLLFPVPPVSLWYLLPYFSADRISGTFSGVTFST
jgi:hypothetical protein